jgi:hypothetical protein
MGDWTGVAVRQQHSKDGSVSLTFSAVVESPDISRSGTLSVVSVDNATWSKTSVVAVPDAGRNIIPLEVTNLLALSNTVLHFSLTRPGGRTCHGMCMSSCRT